MATTTAPARRKARRFPFPDPVNEVSARLVAGGVVLMASAALLTDQRWITLVLAYGFVARVVAGPTFSPLGQLVTKVLTPRLRVQARYVAGPPKRFAQGIGATFSLTAVVLAYGVGSWAAAQLVLAMLLIAASLEAFVGLCLGCKAFALLIRLGVVPEATCERCNDLRLGVPF